MTDWFNDDEKHETLVDRLAVSGPCSVSSLRWHLATSREVPEHEEIYLALRSLQAMGSVRQRMDGRWEVC